MPPFINPPHPSPGSAESWKPNLKSPLSCPTIYIFATSEALLRKRHIPLRWLALAGLGHGTFESGIERDDESPGCSHGKLTFETGEWCLLRKVG